MLGRFLQLFLLASMVLLLPTLFYLSRQHQAYSLTKDYALMQTQISQGQGPPPVPDPQLAQSWKWNKPWEGWPHLGSGTERGGAAVLEKDPKTPMQDLKDGKGAIMPKMANETAKAELGRATWKFLHTMTLRFPDKPTDADRQLLLRFFEDFSQLYPCGECASHFQALLKELPPQTSSRMASALWLCTAHNKVNERLGKPEFPCDKLDETYDCGCGELAKGDKDGKPSDASIANQPPAGPLPGPA